MKNNINKNESIYYINATEVTCINILIKTLEEAIKRKTFNEKEINSIYRTVNVLTRRNVD